MMARRRKPKPRSTATEADVARAVVEHLRKDGHEVFQEVDLGRGRADIVAKKGSIWIIESKVTLSWDLVGQGLDRFNWAEKVSLAVPKRSWGKDARKAVWATLKAHGLGLILVDEKGGVTEAIAPVVQGTPKWAGRLQLHQEQKHFVEAGTKGSYWTPFKGTCRNLLEFVSSNPGQSLVTAIEAIDHHYKNAASAKSSLTKYLKRGVITDIELRGSCLYPKK